MSAARLALLLVALALPLGAWPAQPASLVQRQFVPQEQAAAAVAASAVPWEARPRPEFENLVRAAEKGAARAKLTPRVVQAHLRAVLRDEDLLGAATWEVHCPDACPAFLPLQGPGGAFNLALRQAPRSGDREVLLAEVDARGPGLIFDTPGTHAVELAWSARLDRTPEGLAFEVRGPATPAGLLELYLPAGWSLSGPAAALVAGPLPLPPGKDRHLDQPVPEGFALWRVHGIGRGAVKLRLGPAGANNPPLALVRRWATSHRVAPDGVETTLEAALELLPHGGNEVAFEWDPALRPFAVEVTRAIAEGPTPELATWTLTPGPAERPALLSLRLRQPVNEVVVQVKALAPLTGKPGAGGAVEWQPPAIRAVRGVPRGEKVELLLHPDLRLDSWQPGDFRLTETGTATDTARGVTLARLSLEGGGLRPDEKSLPRRPMLLVHPSGVEFRARPVAWWEVEPRRSTVTAQVACEVQHGRLFGVPLQVPAGWEVEQVEVEPASLAAQWRPRRAGNKLTLLVEFGTPLTPASATLPGESGTVRPQARIKVRLRAGVPLGRAMPFPEIVVPGAKFREGAIAVDVEDELLTGKPVSPLPFVEPEDAGPWGQTLPDAYCVYRNQPLQGALTVTARPASVRAQVRTDVFLIAGREEAETRLTLAAVAGSPDAVEVLVPGVAPPDWQWRVEGGTNTIRAVERLPGPEVLAALASRVPLAGALAAALAQQRYRIALSRPLRLNEELVLGVRIRLDRRAGRWDVPLVGLPHAQRLEGEVEIHLAGTDLVQVETQGLREGVALPRGRAVWRAFRYASGPPRLVLSGREQVAGRLAEAHARLTAWPGDDGKLRVHYQCHLADWSQPTLPVTLPPGAELLAARVDARPVLVEPHAGVLALPLPLREGAARGWHRVEVLYALPAGSGWLWQTLAATPPAVPVEPRTFVRTWRLPPGLAPALADGATRCSGPGDGSDPQAQRFHPADLFRLVPWPRRGDATAEPLSTLPLAQALRASRPGQEVSLREAFERLALAAGRERKGLVVDADAWHEARLKLDARLRLPVSAEGEPAWEQAGLTVVAAPGGWLVTTGRQRAAWGSALPWSVGGAVEQALANGHDVSGRFRGLAGWLGQVLREESLPEGRGGPAGLLPLVLELPGWSAWTPVAGGELERLTVVRREAVVAAGVLLALLGGLGLVYLRGWSRWWRHFWLMVWLAAAGVGLFWLPTGLQPLAWYPLVLGGVLVLLAYLRRLRKAASGADPVSVLTPGVAGATAALVVVFLAARDSWAGQGEEQQPPPRGPVLVVGEVPEQQTVWATTALLDELRNLAESVPACLRKGAVLTGMKCAGKVVAGVATFEATFAVHCFSEDALVALPLEGVHLDELVWLDNAVAKEVGSLPRPREGYQVRVRGAGAHKLEVRFRVPLQSPTTDERLVQFGLPKLPLARLTFAAPEKAKLHAAGRGGAMSAAGEIDLGRLTGPVQLRWADANQPAQAVSVKYQEAYLWDVRADASKLTGLLRYAIERGSVRELTFEVPGDLLVREVKVTRPESGEVRVQRLDLRELPPRDGKPRQELLVHFGTAVTGDLYVLLDLVPREPLPASVELSLPAPRGEQVSGYLAYRLDGLEVRETGLRSMTGVLPGAFAPFWPKTTAHDPKTLAFAATISRQGTPPELRLRLGPRPNVVQVEQELALRVGAAQVDLVARLDVSATGADLGLLEWEITPNVALTSVRGNGVRRWSQQGNRLLVWLERTGATRLEMQGWLPLATAPLKPGRLALPQLRLLATGKQTTTLKLTAAPGLALVPQQENGLRRMRQPTPVEVVYQAEQAGYGGSVLVETTGPLATARVLTFVEVVDQRLVYQALIACRIPQGELRALTVHLSGWEGPAEIAGDRIAQRRERGRGHERSWVLDLQPGTTGTCTFTLSGSVPLHDLIGSPEVPVVTLGGVRVAEAWLAVAGRDLLAEGGQPENDLPADLPATWRGVQDRVRKTGGTFWRAGASPRQVRLTAHAARDGGSPVLALLEERHLRLAEGHWLHEASVPLRFDRQAELAVQWPRAVTVTSVALGGVELPPLQAAADRLWVPLPGQPGVATLRVRWRYEPAETLAEPLLEPLRLEGATRTGPTLWTVDVPPGWTGGGELRDGPGPRVRAHLARAEAALATARLLAELPRERGSLSGQELATQRRFYLHVRQAELLRERSPEAAGVVGPEGEPVSEWAARLLEQNKDQAKELRYEEARAAGEQQARAGVLVTPAPATSGLAVEERLTGLGRGRLSADAPPWPVSGRPVHGWTQGEAVPQVGTLARAAEVDEAAAWRGSLAWVGLIVLVVLLGRIGFLVRRLRRLIPEQLLLVGGLGYLVAGWTPVVIGLLALGGAARVLLLVRGLWPKRPRRNPASVAGRR